MPLPDIVSTLLKNRNIAEEAWNSFLYPEYEAGIHDPFLMKDMNKAVSRIIEAIEKQEKIVIYSDYDCDGIPGAVVLYDFFKVIGYENFIVYIPDRHDEGYGLHKDAITSFKDTQVKLIITIDLGITAVAEVLYAHTEGIDVIVTDHHIPHEILPAAYAILNPKQLGCMYPFKELCGAGVMFKLVSALSVSTLPGDIKIPVSFTKWLFDMVGIATLSDMVPLVGENRVLAHFGLKVLRKTRRPGLLYLYKKTKLDAEHLVEDDITFMIAPRLNAASRLDNPMTAFDTLSLTDPVLAIQSAEKLIKTNDLRKTLVATIMKKVHARSEAFALAPIVVIGDPSWRPGVLGLVASKIVETYQKPAFVWGGDGDVYKGSCRSDGSVHLVDLMTETAHVFSNFGGHEFSGGFSISREHIMMLGTEISNSYDKVKKEKENTHAYNIDAVIQLQDVNTTLYKHISILAPHGVGNQKPVFRFVQVEVIENKHFGSEKNHLEILIKQGNVFHKAMSFFKVVSDFPKLKIGEKIDLIATVEMSYFRGRPEIRLRILDII